LFEMEAAVPQLERRESLAQSQGRRRDSLKGHADRGDVVAPRNAKEPRLFAGALDGAATAPRI